MTQITCLVDPATGRFLVNGEHVPGAVRVPLPRNPDEVRERYTGNPDDPIRDATSADLALVVAHAEAAAIAHADAERRAWGPEANGAVIEAILLSLPELLAEYTTTGAIRVSWWKTQLTHMARSVHRARRT